MPATMLEDFLKHPPGPGESPQARLMNALIDFDKPLIAAVQGAAIGGGTTMLTHCDFVYAGETAKFQMPFVNLALVPEFGSSFLSSGAYWASPGGELILLGEPFDAKRAVVGICDSRRARPGPFGDRHGTAQKLAAKPAARCEHASGSSSGVSRADQDGDEGRKRGVQRASALRRKRRKHFGVSRKTSAQFQQNHEAATAA